MASDDLLRVCYTHEVGMQHLDPDRAAVPAPRDVCECGDAPGVEQLRLLEVAS